MKNLLLTTALLLTASVSSVFAEELYEQCDRRPVLSENTGDVLYWVLTDPTCTTRQSEDRPYTRPEPPEEPEEPDEEEEEPEEPCEHEDDPRGGDGMSGPTNPGKGH